MYKTKKEIEKWLNKYEVSNYHIRDDLTVDVYQSVYIRHKRLKKFLIQFNYIEGSFWCENNQLVSLKGCPKVVLNNFSCDGNKLKNLEFGPMSVGGDYFCNDNLMKNFKGCPKEIKHNFFANNNMIDSLEFIPEKVGANFYCTYNPKNENLNKLLGNEDFYVIQEENKKELIRINKEILEKKLKKTKQKLTSNSKIKL